VFSLLFSRFDFLMFFQQKVWVKTIPAAISVKTLVILMITMIVSV